MKILVTGAAGFIGYHVCRQLASGVGCDVLGIDNLNNYYSVELKRARLAELLALKGFQFEEIDFADEVKFASLFAMHQPDYVVHLGAQAGVRYSTENPGAYVRSNITGFLNVLEACRKHPPKHLVFASSSSIYGAGAQVPFNESQITDQPVSFYGATKKSNELMGYSYAHLHGLTITGLRFFTVYGPWGRPDMSPIIFAKAIVEGMPLKMFNYGRSLRDFTYIEDIVNGILKTLFGLAEKKGESLRVPYRVYNLGHNQPVEMRLFVQKLAERIGKRAKIELLPPQSGDMEKTWANIELLREAVGYEPKISLDEGLDHFVGWFKNYYRHS